MLIRGILVREITSQERYERELSLDDVYASMQLSLELSPKLSQELPLELSLELSLKLSHVL